MDAQNIIETIGAEFINTMNESGWSIVRLERVGTVSPSAVRLDLKSRSHHYLLVATDEVVT